MNNLDQSTGVVTLDGRTPTALARSAGAAAPPALLSGPLGRAVANGLRLVRYFLRKPRRALMLALGRFRPLSHAVVFLTSRPVVRPPTGAPTLFPDVDVDEVLTAMAHDGVYAGINLGPDVVARILEYAHSTECCWGLPPVARFQYADKAAAEASHGARILLGRYMDIEDRCAAVRAVSHDPMLRYIAARHLGREPGQTETRLWWSFAGEATPEERFRADQGFHYDLHDYRRIAFFFYLTDVDASAGPHVHVKGSHVKKPWRMLFRETRHATDAEINERYPTDDVVTLCGPAGFGFATDPFAYHKGAGPDRRDRLLLRVRFTIFDDGVRVDREVSAPAGPRT